MSASDNQESKAAFDRALNSPPRPSSEVVSKETTEQTIEQTPLVQPEQEGTQPESTSEDNWKIEYEAQVKIWRAKSAEAREAAEKERLRWETIRSIEKEEAAKRKATEIAEKSIIPPPPLVDENWENVKDHLSTADTSIPVSRVELESQADLVSSSSSRPKSPRGQQAPGQETDESQKWEDVPSVTSSFPSMSFPDHIETPPNAPPHRPEGPTSVTLAIFDSSLSVRTRLTAFASSLAVNLLLPFVNGVMLGFGEIFAKDIVMEWLGWTSRRPGSMTTNVGIRSGSEERRQRQSIFQ